MLSDRSWSIGAVEVTGLVPLLESVAMVHRRAIESVVLAAESIVRYTWTLKDLVIVPDGVYKRELKYCTARAARFNESEHSLKRTHSR
jgi:hypothetical protein